MKPSKTTNRLHFDDLAQERFEDLAVQVVYRDRKWEDISHDGRSGSDEGVDIRALERLPDSSIRRWAIQCKRSRRMQAAGLRGCVDDALKKADSPPDVLLVLVGCDVSLKARSSFVTYAQKQGVQLALVWTSSILEAKLYGDHPDLLFTFFGVSLAAKAARKEHDLRRFLVMKRRFLRLFRGPKKWTEAIVRSIDDDSYPEPGKRLGTTTGKGISSWFKIEVNRLYHHGLEAVLDGAKVVIERKTGRWSVLPHERWEDDFGSAYYTASAWIVGRLPYRNVLECDEDGDEFFSQPHLFCRFSEGGMPWEEIAFSTKSRGLLDPDLRVSALPP